MTTEKKGPPCFLLQIAVFYRLLVSSNSLLKCSKLIFSVLVMSDHGNWCSRAWPFPACCKPGFGHSRQVIFQDLAIFGKAASGIVGLGI